MVCIGISGQKLVLFPGPGQPAAFKAAKPPVTPSGNQVIDRITQKRRDDEENRPETAPASQAGQNTEDSPRAPVETVISFQDHAPLHRVMPAPGLGQFLCRPALKRRKLVNPIFITLQDPIDERIAQGTFPVKEDNG